MIKREYGGRTFNSLEKVLKRAINLMGKDKALFWWITPLPEKDDKSPYQLCRAGKVSEVLKWLERLEIG